MMICEFRDTHVQLGGRQILSHLDWSIPEGQVIGLLGKNGAGKSTLIRTMLGLIRPTAGAVSTLGVSARSLADEEKTRIGYAPQSAVGYESMRVKNAIEVHASCYERWNHELVTRMLERFEIPLKHTVQKLSVGQRQALMLLFALASEPELLVMDEPLASLDPAARRDTLAFVAEAAGSRTTILYSTHNTADINRLADQVALLANGRIQFCRSAEEVSHAVLLRGELPSELTLSEEFKRCVLQQRGAETLLANWTGDNQCKLPGDVLVQPVNLEELFIRWHQLDKVAA